MMQLKQVVSVYGATRGSLTKRDGGTEESTGSGGGLVSAVEQQGLDTLAASMSEGDTLVLEDAGVSLTLTRERVTARMRVSWADGPNYEETIRVDGVAAPAPMPTTAPTAASTSARRTNNICAIPHVVIDRGATGR